MKLTKILKNHDVWIISDTHWGHNNIIKFTDLGGNRIRPWDTVEDMENDMVEWWNEVVDPNDYIIHLGDIAMNRTGYDRVMPRLNGRKILIQGNHDQFNTEHYAKHFEHVLPMLSVTDTALLTHIPVHPDSIGRHLVNIHGHLHNKLVLNESGDPDPRYVNVSSEQLNFKPVCFKTLLETIRLNRA